jgi:hypothetical protein
MDAVSFIMGKPEEGDAPQCIHSVLRSAFIRTNDALRDSRRHELWPLILRAMGSADRAPTDDLEARRLNVRLAVWCARHVLHLVQAQDRQVCVEAIEAAEKWAEHPDDAAAHAHAADAAAAADANAAAAYAAAHAAAASADAHADAAYAAAHAHAYAAAHAAAHAADAAYAAAHAAAASADAHAAAAYAAAHAYDAANAAVRLASLSALIDEYDRLTSTTAAAVEIRVPWDEMTDILGVTA